VVRGAYSKKKLGYSFNWDWRVKFGAFHLQVANEFAEPG